MILLALFLLVAVWPVVAVIVELAWTALRLAAAVAVLLVCVAWAVVAFGADCTVALLAWRRERRRAAIDAPSRRALAATEGRGAGHVAMPPEPLVDPPWLNRNRVRPVPWFGGWLHPAYQNAWRRLRRRRSRA